MTSLKICQRIPLKNLRALNLSLRSQLLVLLLSNRFLLKSKLFRSIQHWQSLGAPDFIFYYINTSEIPSELSRENFIDNMLSSHVKITVVMVTIVTKMITIAMVP